MVKNVKNILLIFLTLTLFTAAGCGQAEEKPSPPVSASSPSQSEASDVPKTLDLLETDTSQPEIQDVVNGILVGGIGTDAEWVPTGSFTLVSSEQSGRTDRYSGTPERYRDIPSTPGYILTEHFTWHPIDASQWTALNTNRYLLEFSNDCYSFVICSDENKIAVGINGETSYYEGEPIYDGSVFSFMKQFAEAVLLEHEYDVCRADGTETDLNVIAQKLAEQYAQCILRRPGWATQRAADAQVRAVEVFDAYYGEEYPNFCFNQQLYLNVTEEQWNFWQVGSGLNGPYEDAPYKGWYGHSMQVYACKAEDGNWHMTGMATGGSSAILPLGLYEATASQLMEWYFLTEGWTHDLLIPYRLAELPKEDVKAGLSVLSAEQRQALTDALQEIITTYPEFSAWSTEDF